MTPDPSNRVLVTGATGFIALHCIQQLLDAGYSVRGTARSARRGDAVRDVLRPHLADPTRLDGLEVVAADLERDEGWDAAASGCRYVLHVASPFPATPPRDENEIIAPAREGALRVLRAAKGAGAARVVLTSSLAAVLYGVDRDKTFTEADWSNVDDPRIGAYEKSKTLAERAAWEFARANDLELAVINPGAVLGPSLGPDVSTSGEIVKKLMTREFPACPDLHFAMVDVRDVAAAHLAAMTAPEAAGERFLCALGDFSMRDVARVLAAHYGPRGYRIPTAPLPGFLLRVLAIFDGTARLALNDLGRPQRIDNSKIRKQLGWSPRGLEEMTVAMAESLIAHGIVPAKQPTTGR
jgi:nucleoside-diphosphate-sugar epimerase